jgi:hypothetical protein
MQLPPSLVPDAVHSPTITVTLRNGGWDGQSSGQWVETNPHMVATRVASCVSSLVLADAGVTISSSYMLAIIQREPVSFSFAALWKDLRFRNAIDIKGLLFPDDGVAILEWALNAATMFLRCFEQDAAVKRLCAIAETRLLKQQSTHATEPVCETPHTEGVMDTTLPMCAC